MPAAINENDIREKVESELAAQIAGLPQQVCVDQYASSGRPRSAPLYFITVRNATVGKSQRSSPASAATKAACAKVSASIAAKRVPMPASR